MKNNTKVLVGLPVELKKKITELAEQKNIPKNQLIRTAIIEMLERVK